MTLLAEDERMLKNMHMELNEISEDYGMKINISIMKPWLIRRKPKKKDMRFKDESLEQVDSVKYLRCNSSSNKNCCQEVKADDSSGKRSF